MKNFLEEISWRGLIKDRTPHLENYKKPIKAYIGFDPTAPSLQVGNLVTLFLLKHLQRLGHKPVVLIGGGTSMIGDPSGKSKERQIIEEQTIVSNQEKIKKQLIDLMGDDNLEILNNREWLRDCNLIDFFRDIAKNMTVSYLVSKEFIRTRLEHGLSFTEFIYPLLQAYDFYYLFKHKGVEFQMGGADQWGNITSGIDLIRKIESKQAHGLTCPLITNSNGTKFGKTEKGTIWLDPDLTSPYDFYQFWMNLQYEEAISLLKKLSLLTKEDIDFIDEEHKKQPEKRVIQKLLAKEMTSLIHGNKELNQITKNAALLFSGYNNLNTLSEEEFLQSTSKLPSYSIQSIDMSIPVLLQTISLVNSKGEAKKLIKNNGLVINGDKIKENTSLEDIEFLHNRYLIIQKGKKNFYLVKKV